MTAGSYEARALPATGALISRRHFLVGGALAGAGAVSYVRMPIKPSGRTPPGTLEKLMPNRVGPWSFASSSGVVLPPPDATADRLYDNIVTRSYTAPDRPPVMLLIAYSNVQDGLLQIHRPEFCYTAGGFKLSPTINTDIVDAHGQSHGANAFAAAASNRTEQVLYWTRIGKSFPQSWLQQKLAVMKANLQMTTPDGLLARLSVLDDNQERGLQTMAQFIADFDRAAGQPLQAIMFGPRT